MFKRKKVQPQLKPIFLILAILCVVIYFISQSIKQTSISVNNSELARAMTYNQVEEGEAYVDGTNENVKFDAFFLRDINNDGYAESIRGTCKEIGASDTLYMELSVNTEGYLKDGKITINGENFYFQTSLPKDSELKDNYIGINTTEIEFNDIYSGTQKTLTGIVKSGDYTQTSTKAAAIGSDTSNYSKVNSVTLTGKYVTENGEIEIEKKVDFTIDWYGTATASISTTSKTYYDIDSRLDEENSILTLDLSITTEETDKVLILKKNHVKAEIPLLNGYEPLSVEYTGTNGTYSYDPETRIITIDRESVVDEDGKVTSSLSRSNSYSIKIVYPLEAYESLGAETVTIKIPVETYYEGYNNPNDEFDNPYVSNTAKSTIVRNYEKERETGSVHSSYFNITVGKYVSKPTTNKRYVVSKEKPLRIYNGLSETESDDTYLVTWKAYIGTNQELAGLIMKETADGQDQVTDLFIKTDATQDSTDDVVSNIGVYFSGADNILGEDGWIKIYDDETDELLVTFTASDWSKYSSSNPYYYEREVKHIRVETSEVQKNEASLYVYNIKEIDDDALVEKYEREQFDELQYIQSTLSGYIGESFIKTDTAQAHYEAPYSIATISIDNGTISTQATEEGAIITIKAEEENSTYNQVGWENGIFLVKLPSQIIDANINSVTINNSDVKIDTYELIEEDEGLFIKIITKNDKETSYDITINIDLSPDPRIATTTGTIELYASNENAGNYFYNAADKYDVNNNLNTEELVNYTTTSLSMVSPNSLLTNQTASEFDNDGTEVVSPQIADVSPSYAVVDQETEEKTVKIGVQINNNYGSTITDVLILGKIPFENNTYVINGRDLGSTFTTKMLKGGIEIPTELEGKVTVYYSENENATKELQVEENNWVTADEVENWDNIKTFLIDFGDYEISTGDEYVFYYTVSIPDNVGYNEVSYSHHGVYFSLNTESGKYETSTEPSKLGIRIAEKYNLELVKTQTGKEKLVPGATYSITEIIVNDDGEEETGEIKTGVTNSEGTLTIKNLYVEKIYEIKEIISPDDYELNDEVIRFIGYADKDGNLEIKLLNEDLEEIDKKVTVDKQDNENYKAIINVEDEALVSIKIKKTDEETNEELRSVRFKITGGDFSESGKTVTTNSSGEATISGLSVGEKYTLEEVKTLEGYYLLEEAITFEIENKEGNYSVKIIDEENEGLEDIITQSTEEVDSIPTITLNIENEAIPTYDLEILKIERNTELEVTEDEEEATEGTEITSEENYLPGAKFKLYKDGKEVGEYTTGIDGRVTITGLYIDEERDGYEQVYTLKEVVAPEGYAKVKDITFKVTVDEENDSLVLIEIDDAEEESTRYTLDENKIILTVEDSPSFKLVKIDGETQQPLVGVKFAIYNVENGEVPATNSKGEIIGEQVTIDGNTYYVVETDENGEITEDLPEGLYKAVEVEADEIYDLTGKVYYFGIGTSREAPEGIGVTLAESIGGSYTDNIYSVTETSDGGHIAVGCYDVYNGGYGIITKYDEKGKVQWEDLIKGSRGSCFYSVSATQDGGCIVGGYFKRNDYSRRYRVKTDWIWL